MYCVIGKSSRIMSFENMQIRNGFAYYKFGSYSHFYVSTKLPLLGGTFNLTHAPSNKICGFSPLTNVFRCDSKHRNTIRLLDKHGLDSIRMTNESYIKIRMLAFKNQKVNDDCWATSNSPLMCTKPKRGEYGWFVSLI